MIRLGWFHYVIDRHPWILRLPLAGPASQLAWRSASRLGVLDWGTSGFEFWTLLHILLSITRPRSIIELGSGRSTLYFADYAASFGASFISVEQSRRYSSRVRRALRNSFLDPACVHRVALGVDGWYAQNDLDRLVDLPVECLFVDGPAGAQEQVGSGRRDAPRALKWLRESGPSARMIGVDDVHRAPNADLFRALIADRPDLGVLHLRYRPHAKAENRAAFAIPTEHIDAVWSVARALGIGLDPAAKAD